MCQHLHCCTVLYMSPCVESHILYTAAHRFCTGGRATGAADDYPWEFLASYTIINPSSGLTTHLARGDSRPTTSGTLYINQHLIRTKYEITELPVLLRHRTEVRSFVYQLGPSCPDRQLTPWRNMAILVTYCTVPEVTDGNVVYSVSWTIIYTQRRPDIT